MQNDNDQQDAELKQTEPQGEIPLLDDIVLPYVDLEEEDAAQPATLIDSDLAGIEEGEDDLALESLAEEDRALTENAVDDSYDYGDEDEAAHEPVAAGFLIPQHDVVIKAIKNTLYQQLSKEMTGLIAPVMEQAIEQATQQIAQQINDELTYSLEERISALIQQELDKQFDKE